MSVSISPSASFAKTVSLVCLVLAGLLVVVAPASRAHAEDRVAVSRSQAPHASERRASRKSRARHEDTTSHRTPSEEPVDAAPIDSLDLLDMLDRCGADPICGAQDRDP